MHSVHLLSCLFASWFLENERVGRERWHRVHWRVPAADPGEAVDAGDGGGGGASGGVGGGAGDGVAGCAVVAGGVEGCVSAGAGAEAELDSAAGTDPDGNACDGFVREDARMHSTHLPPGFFLHCHVQYASRGRERLQLQHSCRASAGVAEPDTAAEGGLGGAAGAGVGGTRGCGTVGGAGSRDGSSVGIGGGGGTDGGSRLGVAVTAPEAGTGSETGATDTEVAPGAAVAEAVAACRTVSAAWVSRVRLAGRVGGGE